MSYETVDDTFTAPAPAAGTEPPGEVAETTLTVERSFAFVDLCRFTEHSKIHGAQAAVEIIGRFRALIRQVTERRGVRVAKWLGDGAMLVSVNPGALACALVEIAQRWATEAVALRGGCATGEVIIAEGDDYIGDPVNLAARLCDAAGAGAVFSDTTTAAATPDWVHLGGERALRLRGFGTVEGVFALRANR